MGKTKTQVGVQILHVARRGAVRVMTGRNLSAFFMPVICYEMKTGAHRINENRLLLNVSTWEEVKIMKRLITIILAIGFILTPILVSAGSNTLR